MYYQVSYDLNKEKNYDRLYEGIKSYGIYYNVLLSTWIIKADQTAQEVFKKLRALIDDNDHIFVSEVNSNYMARLDSNAAEWLNRQNI